jgi:hypothetical protein
MEHDTGKVFETAVEPSGRIRLDRPFTAEEARAQDERHREIAEEARLGRMPKT